MDFIKNLTTFANEKQIFWKMKKLFYLLTFGIIASMFIMSGCGGDDDDDGPSLTPQQEQAQALSGTWSQQNTTQIPDGVDPTILDQLSITFNIDGSSNPAGFSASGAGDFFTTTSSSSWSFSGSSTTSIELSNVTPVTSLTINSLTENSLSITFTFTSGTARVAGLDGSYTVELSK